MKQLDDLDPPTFLDSLKEIDQRREEGELAIPNYLAALKRLPLEEQELNGTAFRGSLIKSLHADEMRDVIKEEAIQEVINRTGYRIAQSVFQFLGFPPLESSIATTHSPRPPIKEEIAWLMENIDPMSPTECMLLSDLHLKYGTKQDAEEWYKRGLEATRKMQTENPFTPIQIIE